MQHSPVRTFFGCDGISDLVGQRNLTHTRAVLDDWTDGGPLCEILIGLLIRIQGLVGALLFV
jgi:hypothetical protein